MLSASEHTRSAILPEATYIELRSSTVDGVTPLMPFADLADDAPVTSIGSDGAAHLVAARCPACEAEWFPLRHVCPFCATPDPDRYMVGPGGTLYSYSTVHISSARPTPYTLGYVDLDEGVRVLATIVGDTDRLTMNARCRLEVGEDGSWWFVTEEQ